MRECDGASGKEGGFIEARGRNANDCKIGRLVRAHLSDARDVGHHPNRNISSSTTRFAGLNSGLPMAPAKTTQCPGES
jgi:hypothetical protein